MARPSTYDPAYCTQVVEFLKDGYSLAAFAGSIGVSRSTIYEWADNHPEFSDAVKAAQAGSVYAWEQRLRSVALTGEGNATAVIFGLKNRAPDEWREKTLVGSDPENPLPTGLIVQHVKTKPGSDG
jgi:hypothetical protein